MVKGRGKLKLDRETLRKSIDLAALIVVSAACSEPIDLSCGALHPCREFVKDIEAAFQKFAHHVPKGEHPAAHFRDLAAGLRLLDEDDGD
jgi:hypothetical protein